MSLDRIRKALDEIDAQLIPLLAKRMEYSVEVAKIKQKEGLPILHPGREEEILKRVQKISEPYDHYTASVYQSLMDASRELQHDCLRVESPLAAQIRAARRDTPSKNMDGAVACQGVPGAFSNQAAALLYPGAQLHFVERFEDVFQAVETGKTRFGVVPVENSTAGSVSEVYDLILKYRHFITGAIDMSVTQNLLACETADLSTIRQVYSHPHALAQCSEFLLEHGFQPVEFINTAAAAKRVAELGDPSIAAIGSLEAARIYGLRVLTPHIQSVNTNSTRFISVSKELLIPADSNKVSLVFSLPHVTGSLYRTLNRFAIHGLNLTKIESRAAKCGGYQYLFYLDFAGSAVSDETVNLLSDLAEEMTEFAFLGNYKEIKADDVIEKSQ